MVINCSLSKGQTVKTEDKKSVTDTKSATDTKSVVNHKKKPRTSFANHNVS